MNQQVTEEKIQEIAKKIIDQFQPEKIILFGSYAYGKPHKDSDVDFFVIKDTNLPSLKRIEALDRLFSRRPFAMDFLVYTPEQVQRQLGSGDFFLKEIISKGKTLYDATSEQQ